MARAWRAGGWTLGAWGAMHLAALVFARASIATLAVQAILAEWVGGKMAITWSDPLAPVPTASALRRRALTGAGAGLAAAALVAAAMAATGRAVFSSVAVAWGSLAIGAIPAVLVAVRDELLLRGMVLKVGGLLRLGTAGSIALCGAAAAAARYGLSGAGAIALLVEGLRGVALASIWTRDRGAWMAIGASVAWTWTLDTATRGALVDLRIPGGDPVATAPALAVVAALATAAALWASRGSRAA